MRSLQPQQVTTPNHIHPPTYTFTLTPLYTQEQQLDEAFADGLAAEYAAELKGEEEFCRPGSCACCRVAASSRRRQAWRQQQ